MATTNIKEQWTLKEWCQIYGAKFTRAPFINKNSGETFNSLVWKDANNSIIFVNFSKNLGEIDNATMRKMKDQLSVYQIVKENGDLGFSLGKTGSIIGIEESIDFD